MAERGITNRELAHLTGIHRNRISELINKPIQVIQKTVGKLSSALGVSAAEIILREKVE
jgi:plasmid maintenance system antidote protein VapI